MTSPVGFPPATLYDIVDASNANPGVITVSSVANQGAFNLVNGMTITISGVRGMVQLNRQRFILANLNMVDKTFELYDTYFTPVDTMSYPAYVNGGQVNIISYPPQAATPPGLMYNTQPITI